jgi:hypothetical protein
METPANQHVVGEDEQTIADINDKDLDARLEIEEDESDD